jgi:MHS family proline/betaine transporter-like MFS transporter
MVQIIGLVLLHGVGFYVLYVYLPTYLTARTTLPMGTLLTINTVCMALLATLIPLMGRLSDRVGRQFLLRIGAAGLALTAVPLFTWFSGDRVVLIMAAQIFMTVLLACYMGPFFAAVATLFPTSQRYTGLSVSYNIASALFGGTAPLMATVAMEWSGNPLAPGGYVSLCALLSLIVCFTIREDPHQRTEIEPRHLN